MEYSEQVWNEQNKPVTTIWLFFAFVVNYYIFCNIMIIKSKKANFIKLGKEEIIWFLAR